MNRIKHWLRTPFTVRIWRMAKKSFGFISLLSSSLYDAKRFHMWSHGSGLEKDQARREKALLKAYHGFEKGLSLAEPRPGFGVPSSRVLMRQIDALAKQFEITDTVRAAIASLQNYHGFNTSHGIQDQELENWLKKYAQDIKIGAGLGGVEMATRDEIQAGAAQSGPAFFQTRHSIRHFGPDAVPLDAIREAAEMARKTPSVCNRQGSRIYCFENPMMALQWQKGNAGFGDRASRALVITSDLRAFASVGERYQCWIDGGMYAMSVIYALHSKGYGTCPLAWSAEANKDKEARAALGIPDNEVIIMMIAVGTLPDELAVARAFRIPLEESLVFIEPSIS